MTDTQKQRIKHLRGQGVGYKAIAVELDLTCDSVRGFCKRIGLDGIGVAAQLNLAISDKNFCANCAKPIKQVPHGRARRFCSHECRRIWWQKNPQAKAKKPSAIYKFNCAHCGAEFDSYGNKNRKYCSRGCYISHRYGVP